MIAAVVAALELVATVAVELVAVKIKHKKREHGHFLHRHFQLTVVLELANVIMAAVML